MHRAIISTHQPYAIRTVELLKKNHGWEPVYWLCKPEQMPHLRSFFGSELVMHDYLEATHGRVAPAFQGVPTEPFDPVLLTARDEAVGLAMLDRNDSFSQSMRYGERVAFLLDSIGYWCAVIKRTNATTVIFEETPHQAIDYTLYLAASYLELMVISPVRGLPDSGFFASNVLGMPKQTHAEPRAPGTRGGTGAVAFINQMKEDYDTHINTILWDHSDSVREIISNNSMKKRFLSIVRAAKPKKGLSAYLKNFRTFRNDQKSLGRSLQDSQMHYLAFTYYKILTLIKKARNRKTYQQQANKEIYLSAPYIYCCLQYQPEASTSPLAGRYVEQWLMVAQLSAALPKGWKIYVKEHPSQFSGEYARYGESYRSLDFYHRLKSYPGVELAPLELDSFTLIDNSQVVACPGGTVCFEAVSRGKRAINFGQGFFVGCPGIEQVTSSAQVYEAIQKISGAPLLDIEKVRKFAAELDRKTYPGALGSETQLDRMMISTEENARLHVEMCLEVANWASERTS